MAVHCIDIDNSEVQKLSQELGLHKAVVAAKIALWQEANDEVGKRFPNSEELGFSKSKSITFLEESSVGYKARTIKNASADATIDFGLNQKGESWTKKAVDNNKKKYIGINTNNLSVSKEMINEIVSELNSINKQNISVANIPQNLISGVESFGTKQNANSEVKKILGDSPHSIDMIEVGLRTRTTRSVGEMQKYNIKVGDIVTQFGKSADGTTKQILTKITAIYPKGTPEFLETWSKEGWTQDGIKAIERFKDGAAAIEFEIVTEHLNSINTEDYKWSRYSDNSYEVSSKGDKRFSAFYAQLNDGRYIEDIYQLDIKGNGVAVSKPLTDRQNPTRSTIKKTGEFKRQVSREQSWNEYKNLWRTYLNENPNLKQDLIEKSKGKVLTDMFASTDVSQARALAEILNEQSKKEISLNIAGNGIYTMKGKYTQQEIDDYTYNLLKSVIDSPKLNVNITSLRTGGQTGFDEAGAKAGVKLNIPTTILAPKGYTFRNINGQDINNEQQFKERFKTNVSKTIVKKVSNNNQSILKRISEEYFKAKEVSDIFISLQNLQQLIKGFKGSFTEAESFINALNKLGYSINNDFTDIVKNDKETDKFYKNYTKINESISGLDNLLNDKFLRQSIKTAIELIKLSKGFFISQTEFVRKTNKNTSSLFKEYISPKPDFKDNLRKNQLAYYCVTAYKNAMKDTDDKIPHIKDFLLTPLSEIKDDDTKKYNELQSKLLQIINYDRNNGKKNDFIDILQLDNIDYTKKQSALYGHRLHLFTADSRNIKDPDKISRLISGFNELYFAKNNNINLNSKDDSEEIRINNLKTEFAKDIFKYLVLKDALLFQNQSFIKAIDPILFLETSNMLDKVQELFKKNNPSQSEFIKLFGMTKEELNVDFITKFGLHSENYFDLNSQKLAVILTNRDEIKKKVEKDTIDNIENGNENNEEINDTLIKEDNFPLYWDNVDKTLTVNIFAGQTSQMNNEEKNNLKKENKKFILRKENEIFKPIITSFVNSDNKVITYPKIGLPIITYVTKKEGNTITRIPLKLSIIQDTIKADNIYVTFQANINGKIVRVDNKTMQSFKQNNIYFTDLQKYSIFDISENAYKLELKTDKSKIPLLIEIANKIKENYKGGFITGTKAKYTEHVILGTNKLSSLTDDLQSQLEIKSNIGNIEPTKMSMFNRKDNTLTEDKQRKILVDEINKLTGNSLSLEAFKNVPTKELNDILKTQMKIKDSSLNEKQIEDKIKECFKIK